MLDLLSDPFTWSVLAVVAIVGVFFGRLRREPWWVIAATVIGYNGFLLGLRWTSNLGEEAFWATSLASGGMALVAEGAIWNAKRSAARKSDVRPAG